MPNLKHNHDLLTKEETAAAASQGWSLHHVFDLTTSKWRVMVLGGTNAEYTSQQVVSMARMGNVLAQKALGIIMKSNQGI